MKRRNISMLGSTAERWGRARAEEPAEGTLMSVAIEAMEDACESAAVLSPSAPLDVSAPRAASMARCR